VKLLVNHSEHVSFTPQKGGLESREMTANAGHKTNERERGQTLVLFSFMIAAVLLIGTSVIDVGFFLHARQQAQSTADAAALAGAQELPSDPDAAEAIARDYINRNGLDGSVATITFSCTSDTQQVCLDGDGRYDTIRVTPKVKSPSFLGGALSLLGIDSCWVDGCNAQASAAGCRGACGPIGTGPADIVTILDHSLSMSVTDEDNAQTAINSMFQAFNRQYQQVGLGITPPVDPSNRCDTANNWTDPLEWLPGALTDTFQTSPHVLDPTSPPVHYMNCTDRPSGELNGNYWGPYHTDLGSPLQAAANELAANGRPDVVHGIILVTDGAASAAPPPTTTSTITTTTGEYYCTAQAAVTSASGDNNGYESSPGNGCANAGGFASDNSSGTTTSTSCGSSGKDRHIFYNFGMPVAPAGATISGVRVRTDAWGTTASQTLCVEVSWNGGSSWTGAKTNTFGSSEQTKYYGGTNDTWGRTWSASDFTNGNFRVRITDVDDTTTTSFRLDAVSVNYTYSQSVTIPGVDSEGPCDWAIQQAIAAKSLGIEIYTIGFGVDPTEKCRNLGESSASAYYNYTAIQLLTAIATDANHYYAAPKTQDLTGIFAAIGSQLTGGSRLVE
jgi:hypothetical protein